MLLTKLTCDHRCELMQHVAVLNGRLPLQATITRCLPAVLVLQMLVLATSVAAMSPAECGTPGRPCCADASCLQNPNANVTFTCQV